MTRPTPTSLLLLLFLILPGVASQAQQISYLLPDIGAPGMNTCVEFIGPKTMTWNFGPDGLHMNEPGDRVRIECARPEDTAIVVLSPFVVSWQGRMISTQIFVREGATPNSPRWDALDGAWRIPLRVVVDGNPSNTDTFYVVQPSPNITIGNNGRIGDPAMAIRSRRGAVIYESLTLDPGDIGVDARDCDPWTDGNQGLLPVVVISRGPIRSNGAATIHLDAGARQAAPGGGGGGGAYCDVSGGGENGGDGFTGGGRGGQNKSGVPFSSDFWKLPGTGSGPFIGIVDKPGHNGGSLNGVPGGTSDAYEASGGGTGHPFGTSGTGCVDGSSHSPVGGFGGGSGWTQNRPGGAGGFATAGVHPGVAGGRVHGNVQLVPLAGGSGGASGNPQGLSVCSGSGGGGGGAIALFGRSLSGVGISATGGTGTGGSGQAHGGSGSGGGILIGSKARLAPAALNVDGGRANQFGGQGRVRADGIPDSPIPPGASFSAGPTTDTSHWVQQTFTLTGTGNGSGITLFLKEGSNPWQKTAVVMGYANNAWSQPITLSGNESECWLIALQDVPNHVDSPDAAEPIAVLSQAAANVLRFRQVPRIESVSSVMFDTLACATGMDTIIMVRNSGRAALTIDSVTITVPFSLTAPVIPATIPAGDSLAFRIRFAPPNSAYGPFSGTLRLLSNDTARTRNPFIITLEARYDNVALAATSTELHFDTLHSCEGTTRIRTITLRNTGTVPLRLMARTAAAAPYAISSPGSFPQMLAPGATIDVQVRFAPTATGPFTDTLIVDGGALGCPAGLRIPISGRHETVSYTAATRVSFRPLLCAGDTSVRIFTITNTGSAALLVPSPTITGAGMTLVAPAFPLTLAPGASQDVTLRFAPTANGTVAGSFATVTQPCDGAITVTLDGMKDSLRMTAADVSFGLTQPNAFPASRSMVVTNTGTVDIVVTGISVSGAIIFTSSAAFPITVKAGTSETLPIVFSDPGTDGTYSADITLLHSPSCAAITARVDGIRGGATATIQPGIMEGPTGATIRIPIFLRASNNLTLGGATAITTSLRFNAAVLYPLFEPRGTLRNGERIIPLTMPFSGVRDGIIGEFPFAITLGEQDTATLWLEGSTGEGGWVGVTELPGFFRITNICREGGVRHFTTSGRFALMQNRPNPFNASTLIDFDLLADGPARLVVTDRLGREVAVLVDGWLPAGRHTASFVSGELPSGVYDVHLVVDGGMLRRTMTLMK